MPILTYQVWRFLPRLYRSERLLGTALMLQPPSVFPGVCFGYYFIMPFLLIIY